MRWLAICGQVEISYGGSRSPSSMGKHCKRGPSSQGHSRGPSPGESCSCRESHGTCLPGSVTVRGGGHSDPRRNMQMAGARPAYLPSILPSFSFFLSFLNNSLLLSVSFWGWGVCTQLSWSPCQAQSRCEPGLGFHAEAPVLREPVAASPGSLAALIPCCCKLVLLGLAGGCPQLQQATRRSWTCDPLTTWQLVSPVHRELHQVLSARV